MLKNTIFDTLEIYEGIGPLVLKINIEKCG